MEELTANLKAKYKSVNKAKRLTRGKEKKDTESVLVEFETTEILKELYIGYFRYPVREYIPKPVRCFNCQKFGHITFIIARINKRRCARCGGNHEYRLCGKDAPPKCCHCRGEHSAVFWGL